MKRRKVFGRAAAYTLANVTSAAIPFLMLPVLTRVLTPAEYGLVAIFTLLVSAFRVFTGLSVHGAVNVSYFEPGIEHPRYVGTALAILSGSSLIVLLAVLLGGNWISEQTGMARGWVLLAVLGSAAHFIVQIRLVLWQAQGMAIRYGFFQVFQAALNMGLSLVLVLGAGLGWEGRAAGILTAVVGTAGLALFSLHRGALVNWRLHAGYARDALRFGLPLMPHALGSMFIAHSDRLIVASLTSVHEAGIYAAGMQIGLVVGVIADAFTKAISPWLYANLATKADAMRRRIVRVTYLYFVSIAAVALIVGIAAPYLLLFVGKGFRSSQDVVAFVALGSAFGGMYLMVVSYVFYARRNEWLSVASLSVGTFNLLASYFLVRLNGAVGAAQAYAGSQLLIFVAVWYIAARVCPMPWGHPLRIRALE